MGKTGKREYVQVLRLLETFNMGVVQDAIQQALDMGAIGYDAVKHLVLCRVEKRPPRLDLDFYPYLPKANAGTTRPNTVANDINNQSTNRREQCWPNGQNALWHALAIDLRPYNSSNIV